MRDSSTFADWLRTLFGQTFQSRVRKCDVDFSHPGLLRRSLRIRYLFSQPNCLFYIQRGLNCYFGEEYKQDWLKTYLLWNKIHEFISLRTLSHSPSSHPPSQNWAPSLFLVSVQTIFSLVFELYFFPVRSFLSHYMKLHWNVGQSRSAGKTLNRTLHDTEKSTGLYTKEDQAPIPLVKHRLKNEPKVFSRP